jgi:hypothetical protein
VSAIKEFSLGEIFNDEEDETADLSACVRNGNRDEKDAILGTNDRRKRRWHLGLIIVTNIVSKLLSLYIAESELTLLKAEAEDEGKLLPLPSSSASAIGHRPSAVLQSSSINFSVCRLLG